MMNFTRRRFIKTLVIAAGAASLPLLAGCDDKDSAAPATEPDRNVFPHSVMSGDPRPNSVILWTRVDHANARSSGSDVSVSVQVSTSPDFSTVIVEETRMALAENDHCLKVRITGLDSRTHYYYRFIHDGSYSPVGRTKTAPEPEADVRVKYAFVSCQDYIGRYFNLYARLLEDDMDDLDFIAHLGDYVYETTGDPDFQQASEERRMVFDDTEGALALKADSGETFYAAQSLDNYRQVYKTYRTDAMLQRVQEKFPVVAIWDDHEFSDDSWQINATVHGVQTGEGSPERKLNSEQAWLEFMPIDQDSVADNLAEGTLRIDIDTSQLSRGTVNEAGIGELTQGVRIYRSLRFGKHFELFMADYRTFRPDHLVPESAFPGTVISPVGPATQEALAYFDYSDLSPTTQAVLVQLVTAMYQTLFEGKAMDDAQAMAESTAASVVQGNLSASYMTQLIQAAVAAGQLDSGTAEAMVADIQANVQPMDGLSYFSLGKTSLHGELGSRYLVVKSAFDALSQVLVPESAQNPYGDTQWNWLRERMATSPATWRVLGSSVSLTPMVLGLASVLPDSIKTTLPAMLQNDFYLNLDQWDGFQRFRDQVLLPAMRATDQSPNAVLTIAGDIHSNWVSDHGEGRYCFTTSSISSATFSELLESQAADLVNALASADPSADVGALQAGVDQLLALGETIVTQSDDRVRLGKLNEHGMGIMEVDGVAAEVTFVQMLPDSAGLDMVHTSWYDNTSTALDRFFERKYRVENGVLVRLS